MGKLRGAKQKVKQKAHEFKYICYAFCISLPLPSPHLSHEHQFCSLVLILKNWESLFPEYIETVQYINILHTYQTWILKRVSIRWLSVQRLICTTYVPKSYVIIFTFLGNERLAVYGRFLVLWLRVSTQKNTVTTIALICSILFGMKGSESDCPTYLLHFYIIYSSATNRWESQILRPSYRIKLSKIHIQNRNNIKKYEKYDDDRMDISTQNMSIKLIGLMHMIST